MDLRRLAAVLLISAAALVMFVVYVQQQAKQRQAAQTAATAPSATSSAPSSAPARPAARTTTHPMSPETASAPAPSVTWFGTRAAGGEYSIGGLEPNGYLLQLQLSSLGGGIYTAKLADYFVTVADRQLYRKDPAGYDAARAAQPDKYKGHYSVLNPMPGRGEPLLPLATRGLTVEIEGRPDAGLVLDDLDSRHWALEELSSDRIRLAYVLYRGENWEQARSNPILKLTKTYQLAKGDFSVTASLKVENLSDLRLKVSLDQLGPTGVPREDPRRDNRRVVYGRLSLEDRKVRVTAKAAKELGSMQLGQEITLGSSNEQKPLLWVGQLDKFFGAIMYLLPETPGQLYSPSWKAQFYVLAAPEGPHPQSRTFVTGMRIPELQLPPGGPARELRLDFFVGPKKRDLFSDASAPHAKELYTQLNYLGTIEFGGCSWAPLTLGMMWLLQALSKATLGNYGVAIILLVFLVRIALHPLTKKGQVSMMKMQKFTPQMQKLREKYADDKAALNRETMQLYKQQGATPLLGCLPMVLQMPIWIALFTALNVAVELRHAAFLPVWITDLAGPDALFTWPAAYSIPLFGNTLNLLPILLTVAMFFQTKMTPQMTPTASASPDAARQQKMMQYMMPVMMLFLFYNTPSGLTLYIMASTFAGVAEQAVIRRHIRVREAAAAAAETTIEMPGKAARASRPKKPKGPLWIKRG